MAVSIKVWKEIHASGSRGYGEGGPCKPPIRSAFRFCNDVNDALAWWGCHKILPAEPLGFQPPLPRTGPARCRPVLASAPHAPSVFFLTRQPLPYASKPSLPAPSLPPRSPRAAPAQQAVAAFLLAPPSGTLAMCHAQRQCLPGPASQGEACRSPRCWGQGTKVRGRGVSGQKSPAALRDCVPCGVVQAGPGRMGDSEGPQWL